MVESAFRNEKGERSERPRGSSTNAHHRGAAPCTRLNPSGRSRWGARLARHIYVPPCSLQAVTVLRPDPYLLSAPKPPHPNPTAHSRPARGQAVHLLHPRPPLCRRLRQCLRFARLAGWAGGEGRRCPRAPSRSCHRAGQNRRLKPSRPMACSAQLGSLVDPVLDLLHH